MPSFSVAPSPYNPIKFELGVWLLLSLPAWIVVHSFTESEMYRFLFLAAFSSIAALRLLFRIRKLQRKLRETKPPPATAGQEAE